MLGFVWTMFDAHRRVAVDVGRWGESYLRALTSPAAGDARPSAPTHPVWPKQAKLQPKE